MRFYEQNKQLCVAVAIFLGALFVFWLIPYRMVAGRTAKVAKEIETGKSKLQLYFPGSTELPLLSEKREEAEGLDDKRKTRLAEIMADMEFELTEKPFKLPAGEKDLGFYYLRTLHKMEQDLEELANENTVALSATVDVRLKAAEAPDDRDVPRLLLQLAMTDRLIRIAVEKARVASIEKIRHLHVGDAGPEATGEPMVEYPIDIQLIGKTESLVRFLHEIQRPKSFFAVERMELRAKDRYDEGSVLELAGRIAALVPADEPAGDAEAPTPKSSKPPVRRSKPPTRRPPKRRPGVSSY